MKFYTPGIKDVKQIQEALKNNQKKCCEMSPANTVLWARHYRTEIAFWEGNLIYRSQMADGKYGYACNLLNSADPRALFDYIVERQRKEENPFRLRCVMEEEWQMIEKWYPDQYQITYDREASDYIYDREKLSTLAGKKLHGKRNHIHRFVDQNPDWSYERITEQNAEECAKMAIQWCLNNCAVGEKDINYDKIDESKLVVYAIRHREELGIIGGALRVNGKIIAISLGEHLTSDTFVVHFEKAFSEIQGAYPMINQEFVRNELSEYHYVNREEDLGIEGLRKAKLSYHPDILLKKGVVVETEMFKSGC